MVMFKNFYPHICLFSYFVLAAAWLKKVSLIPQELGKLFKFYSSSLHFLSAACHSELCWLLLILFFIS